VHRYKIVNDSFGKFLPTRLTNTQVYAQTVCYEQRTRTSDPTV
jgi:hypothetical protein